MKQGKEKKSVRVGGRAFAVLDKMTSESISEN